MSQILSLILPDELYHQIENVELSGKRSLQETIIYLLKKAVDSEISPSKLINDRSENYDCSRSFRVARRFSKSAEVTAR